MNRVSHYCYEFKPIYVYSMMILEMMYAQQTYFATDLLDFGMFSVSHLFNAGLINVENDTARIFTVIIASSLSVLV